MPTKATEVKPNTAILLDGQIHLVLATEFTKPGKGPAYIQLKTKNVETGTIKLNRVNSSDKVDDISLTLRAIFGKQSRHTRRVGEAHQIALRPIHSCAPGNLRQRLAALGANGAASDRIRARRAQSARDAPPAPQRERCSEEQPEDCSVEERVDREARPNGSKRQRSKSPVLN